MEIVDIRIFVFNFRKNDVNLKMIIIYNWMRMRDFYLHRPFRHGSHRPPCRPPLFWKYRRGNRCRCRLRHVPFRLFHRFLQNTNKIFCQHNLMIDMMMMMMLLQDMTGIYYGSIYMVQLTTSKRANRRAAISRKYWRQQQSSAKEAEMSKQICYCCHRAR